MCGYIIRIRTCPGEGAGRKPPERRKWGKSCRRLTQSEKPTDSPALVTQGKTGLANE